MTRIGILITYHNEGPLLTECLNSVCRQLQPGDGIYIYDDASVVAAAGHVPEGLRVTLIRGEVNRGPSFGRNTLLATCENEFVHFHDADDFFHPEWRRRVGGLLDENIDAVFTEVSAYTNNELTSGRVLGLSRLLEKNDLTRFCIGGSMLVPAGTYRRQVVLKINGYREDVWQSEDYDFHVRLAARRIRYAAIADSLVGIRVRGEGRSQNRVEVWASAARAVERLSTELPPEYSVDLANAASRAGAQLFRLGASRESDEAFRVASKIGPPSFVNEKLSYRLAAKACGPRFAERAGKFYRRLIPLSVRNALAKSGF